MNRRRALMSVGGGATPTVHGTWEDLFARIADGTYATAYSLGEILPLDVGTEGVVNAQIVAFNADDKADGSGKARISFITEKCIKSDKRFNPALSPSSAPYTNNTGAVGGWPTSEIRTWLKSNVLTKIPSDVASRIVEVTKYSKTYDTSGSTVNNVTSTDDIWIPSTQELNVSKQETSGTEYSVFSSDTTRKKLQAGTTNYRYYWSRSAGNSAGAIYRISDYGSSHSSGPASNRSYIAIGFCID